MKRNSIYCILMLLIISSCGKKNNDQKDLNESIGKLNGQFLYYQSSRTRVYWIDTLTGLAADSTSIATSYWNMVGNIMKISSVERNDSIIINVDGGISAYTPPVYVQYWTSFYRMKNDLPQTNVMSSTLSFGYGWYPTFDNFTDTNLSVTYPPNVIHDPIATFNYYPESDSVFINHFHSVPDYTATHKIRGMLFVNQRYSGKYIR